MKAQKAAADGEKELTITGSSASSLHAKTLAVDNNRVFIGSFNFDPRSAYLNCEMGFLIASPPMAKRLSDAFRAEITTGVYRVVLKNGNLRWIETSKDGMQIDHENEPGMTLGARVLIAVLDYLPIEWLL